MRFVFLSLFPDEIKAYFLKGIFKKAFEKGLFDARFIQLRDFTRDKHKKVDDYPFGESLGMLIKPDVIYDAVTSIEDYAEYRIIYPCPKGRLFDQRMAYQWQDDPKDIIFIVGYYEGIDDRVFQVLPIERVSIGDFILSSGELPSMMMAESVIRLLPGVLGNQSSAAEDSIISGLLEYPQYTYPREFQGLGVPEVLLSGHHQNMAKWQRQAALRQTLFEKPQLLTAFEPSDDDKTIIAALLKEESL